MPPDASQHGIFAGALGRPPAFEGRAAAKEVSGLRVVVLARSGPPMMRRWGQIAGWAVSVGLGRRRGDRICLVGLHTMTARVQYNSAGVNRHGQEYGAHWSIVAWDPARLRLGILLPGPMTNEVCDHCGCRAGSPTLWHDERIRRAGPVGVIAPRKRAGTNNRFRVTPGNGWQCLPRPSVLQCARRELIDAS